MIDRRTLITRSTVAAVAALGGCGKGAAPAPTDANTLPPLFDDIEERAFRYFWERANPANGLVPDRWPSPSFCSIAAVGFALTAYPVGVARGWITRGQARDRTLATLRFFDTAPQGPAAAGTSGHRGFFYHFLDMERGRRFRTVELSTVDSALLFMGMLFAAAWFDADDPAERELRMLAARIVDRADWRWMQDTAPLVCMGWHPETGFIEKDWTGYNEAMIVYLLALGSTAHAVGPEAWTAWTASYPAHWQGSGDTRHVAFAPMFGHQYSHVWVDFRGLRDAPMRAAGFDYFENSRRATYAQRAYAIANPMRWTGYGADQWGLTACDGPAHVRRREGAVERRFAGYSARGPVHQPDGFDDGTIAPTAALGSLPFAPEIVVPCVEAMHRRHGSRIYKRYGFLDAFNASFRATDVAVERGSVDPTHGWVAGDWLGIDQGPIVAMIANHRDGMVWNAMRRSPVIARGLRRAGFTGGWLNP